MATLGDLIAQVQQLAPRDPTGRLQIDWFLIRQFINRRYREVLGKTRWSFLLTRAVITTTAPYTTGTISTTTGSTTITGTGTSWGSQHVGMYLSIANAPLMQVTAVASPTSATLEAPCPVTQTNASYAFVQPYYSMPPDFATPVNKYAIQGGYWRLMEVPPTAVDRVDPQRMTQSKPWLYMWAGYDSATPPNRRVELWPIPDAVYALRVSYMKAAPDLLLGTDTPLLPTPQMLVWGALVDCYEYFAAVLAQPGLAQGAEPYARQYQALIDDAVERDMTLQGLPSTQEENLPLAVPDDILYRLGLPIPL